MEIVIYFLPIFFAILVTIFAWKYMVWWEYLILIGGSMAFTWVLESIMIYASDEDTEYLGGYVTKITHYDEWDEWVEKTCTREVEDGKDERGQRRYHTETYDCSYRDYHPEYWKYTDNFGRENYFWSKKEFDYAMKELGYPKMVFRDMHRDYYRIDGDAQDYYYDGKIEHVKALVSKHKYRNRVIHSKSIFNFEDISKDEAKELGLFDYPDIEYDDQDVILGKYFGTNTVKKFKYINSVYGPTKQFRIYIIVFNGKPYNISELQRAYWKGGNKNEFVVCMSYEAMTGKITWCNAFSWCDKPDLEVATERFFREHPRLDYVDAYGDWLMKNIHLWKRKEFHDFDYIDTELSTGQAIALFILTLIADFGLCIFCIGNEFTNGELMNSPFLYKCKSKQREWMRKIVEFFKKTRQTLSDSRKKVYLYIINLFR